MAGLDPELCDRFHRAVEFIGRRWTGAIVEALLERPRRFAELRSAVPGISDRMLSQRLRELEEWGIVSREVLPRRPVRVEYRLTAKGAALEPAVRRLAAVNRLLIRGHLDKELRSLRYFDRLRRETRRLQRRRSPRRRRQESDEHPSGRAG